MKKILLFVVLVTTFISCSSPEKQAKKLVKQYLKESLNDWSSYEDVKFTSLDSVYNTVFEDLEYIKIDHDILINQGNYLLYDDMKYLDICMSLEHKKDSIIATFVPKFKGWSIDHSFRSNNLNGCKEIYYIRCYFDKNITKVVDSEYIKIK